jgi:hypothetical protein
MTQIYTILAPYSNPLAIKDPKGRTGAAKDDPESVVQATPDQVRGGP